MKKVIVVNTGRRGLSGDSAYDEWIAEGNVGTEEDFLEAIKGEKGDTGSQGVPGKDAEQQIPDPGEVFTLLFENGLV